jgi:ankyrin repeat protein
MNSFTNETLELAISNLICSERSIGDLESTGDLEIERANFRRVISAGADVNARFKFEQTALMYACQGSLTAARVLIEMGADVNAIGDFGSNALFTAIGNNQNEIVELLIQHGADIHSESTSTLNDGRFNSSPIVYAVAVGNLTAANLLLHHGANPNTTDRNGETPLGRATAGEIRNLLIERGATTLLEQTENALCCA